MRLVAVVADTHIPTRAPEVPKELMQDLERHEPYKILHAGDILTEDVLDDLAFVAPVHAVQGNNDDIDVPYEYAETFEQTRIAMRHQPHLHDFDTFADRHDADIVVHGHTHTPKIDEHDGVTRVNPGSPTVSKTGDATYALISIEEQQFDVDIHTFS